MDKKTQILGIVGSLRKDSFNKTVMQTAVEMAGENVKIELFTDLGKIPPFNQDEERTPPSVVVEFKKKIREADAILFVTPEYNYSIPGVLKNAIDWASRPYGDNAWEGKPVGIMSASGSMLGGARAQYHLRQTFVFLDMHPVNRPEVIIPNAGEKIQDGKIIDDKTREKIKEMIEALVKWTKELKKIIN